MPGVSLTQQSYSGYATAAALVSVHVLLCCIILISIHSGSMAFGLFMFFLFVVRRTPFFCRFTPRDPLAANDFFRKKCSKTKAKKVKMCPHLRQWPSFYFVHHCCRHYSVRMIIEVARYKQLYIQQHDEYYLRTTRMYMK